MLIIVGCALVVFWLLAVFVFKVTKALIHVALIVAVIAIVVHFMNAR